MKHLAILGHSGRLLRLAGQLQAAGFTVTLLPGARASGPADGIAEQERTPSAPSPKASAQSPRLILLEATCAGDLESLAIVARDQALPWLAVCGKGSRDGDAVTDDPDLITAAYRAGALAVLPAGAGAEIVVQAVERALVSMSPSPGNGARPQLRHYRAGDVVALRPGEMLRILDGVVAQVAWHEDGAEGLIGLWGSGHLLSGHPEDECCLSLRAHTAAVVEVAPLTAAGDAFERLIERVRRLEAWSSMQSRQNMEQRLLGVLSLLAEQFGVTRGESTVIDVRVTHAQLAAAIGATRATVTRLLGPLRRRGQVSTVAADSGERFCLPRWHGGAGHDGRRDVALVSRA